MEGATDAFLKSLGSDIGGKDNRGFRISETAPSYFYSHFFVIIWIFIGGGKSVERVVDVNDSGFYCIGETVSGNFLRLGNDTWWNTTDSTNIVVIEVVDDFDLLSGEMFSGCSSAIVGNKVVAGDDEGDNRLRQDHKDTKGNNYPNIDLSKAGRHCV